MTADNIIDGQYDTQGWNRYSYVKNNPIMYKDPTGHEKLAPGESQQFYNEVGNSGGIIGTIAGKGSFGPGGQTLATKPSVDQNPFARNMQSTKGPLDRLGESAHKNPDTTLAYTLGACLGMPSIPIGYEIWKKISSSANTSSVKMAAQRIDANTPRVQLDGGALNVAMNMKLLQFAEETDTHIKSSMGNSRSATRLDDGPTSQHYYGNAFDFIQFNSQGTRLTVEQSADLARQSRLFTGIEISPVGNFVHVDSRQDRTVDNPLLMQQMTGPPDYSYTYGNDSPYWKTYHQGKYIQYPK